MRWTLFPLMEGQSAARPEAAPAGVAARDLAASLLDVGEPGSRVREDHREVSPLSREGLSSVGGLTFDLPDSRAALAYSPILPPLSRRPLAREAVLSSLVCEARRTTGLPRSADVSEGVGSRLYAGGSTAAPQEFGACGPGHVPFGPSVTAACAWPW